MGLKIEDIFNGAEDGTLTLEQFQAAAKEKGANFVDLSGGDYIGIRKHNSEIEAKDNQISTLNDTLSERDKDLASLQEQLKDAGNDAEKLSTVSGELTALQNKYEQDTKAFQNQLAQQAREFAIKEYAGTKNFTSSAAKRDYIETMKKTDSVKLDKNGELKGVSDFDSDYTKDNADAFITGEQNPEPEQDQGLNGGGSGYQGNPLPMFVQQTQGEAFKPDAKESFGFSFLPRSEE